MAKGTLVKIEPNGTLTHVRVESPAGWTVEQLYHLIGCEIVEKINVRYDEHSRIAFVDEEARVEKVGKTPPPVNPKATQMGADAYRLQVEATKPILGVAVVWVPDGTPGVGRRGVISTRRKKAKDTEGPINRFGEGGDAK